MRILFVTVAMGGGGGGGKGTPIQTLTGYAQSFQSTGIFVWDWEDEQWELVVVS